MRRLILAVIVAATLAGLSVPAISAPVVTDPFDKVDHRTAKGDPVYIDDNHDGVIRPDRQRAVGATKAMRVEGADEVVLLDSEADPGAVEPVVSGAAPAISGAFGAGSLAVDCWKNNMGESFAEASWWGPSGAKYTFSWRFNVDYLDHDCDGYNPTGLDDSYYSASMSVWRENVLTGGYFRNDNAVWRRLDAGYPNCAGGCIEESAYRDFGWSGWQSDGRIDYRGSAHQTNAERWYSSASASIQAIFTAPDPDHPTLVYCAQSRWSGIGWTGAPGGVMGGQGPSIC